jgi:hypothetical protein
MIDSNNSYWTRWLVGILWAIIFGAFVTLGNNVIANDKASRQRDDEMKDKLVSMCEKQQECNNQILIKLAKIETDIDYLKRAGR